jgi:predicted RNA-binding protein with PIN domain
LPSGLEAGVGGLQSAWNAAVRYLIDGHNLIGRLPGISLEADDDEARLLAVLRSFCARERSAATVYFDGAVIASSREAGRGGVTARFVAPPQTADAAIRRHLARLGREASNWTVVSSDGAVATDARRAGAKVESSEAFALRVIPEGPGDEEKPPAALRPEEVARWEEAFKRRKPGIDRG